MRIISFRHAAFYFRHAAHGVWSCGVFISSCGVLPPLMGRLASPLPSLISTGFCCAVPYRVERCSVRGQSRVGACQGAENAGRRLAVKLAAHPPSPRTRRLGATSLRSCARLRRIYPPLRFGAFPGIFRRFAGAQGDRRMSRPEVNACFLPRKE